MEHSQFPFFLRTFPFPKTKSLSPYRCSNAVSVLERMKLTLKEQSATQFLNSAGGGGELLRQMLWRTRRRAYRFTAGTQPVTSVCFSFLPNL